MELTISVALLVSLIWKIGDWFKYITNKDWKTAVSQGVFWVIGAIVVLVAGNANAFESLVIPGMADPLGALDTMSLILIGVALGSAASVGFDFKRALDGADSAKMPPLIPSDTPPQ